MTVTGAPRHRSCRRASCFGCSVLACWPRVRTFRSNSPRMRPSRYRFVAASALVAASPLAAAPGCSRGIHTEPEPLVVVAAGDAVCVVVPRAAVCAVVPRCAAAASRCAVVPRSACAAVPRCVCAAVPRSALRFGAVLLPILLAIGALLLAVLRAVPSLLDEIFAMVLPVITRVLAVIVVVVPCVVVHVGAAVPSVRAVVVVVVDGRANRDAGRKTNQARDGRVGAVVLNDRRRGDVNRLHVVLRHVHDLRVRRLDDDDLLAARRRLRFDFLLGRGLESAGIVRLFSEPLDALEHRRPIGGECLTEAGRRIQIAGHLTRRPAERAPWPRSLVQSCPARRHPAGRCLSGSDCS